MSKYMAYKKSLPHTYTLGAFPTIEALETLPEKVQHVYIHPDYYQQQALIERLDALNITYDVSGRSIRRLAAKQNTLVVGVLDKFLPEVHEAHHIVLENIANMGNLGTIIRTMVGLGLNDLVTVGNVCDIYHPKVIRASMGAIFKIRLSHYDSMAAYHRHFAKDRQKYFFLLNEQAVTLNDAKQTLAAKYFSLIFGNEGAGLAADYTDLGTAVFIPQTAAVDSLNLPISVAIGLYTFLN